MIRRPLLMLLLLLFTATATASEIKTFDLQHRSAEELIPVLRPMVEKGGAISGQGYLLIIRSSKENLQQLGAMIERLDKAPTMLRILVDREGEQQGNSTGASVSGSSDHARISVYSNQQNRNHNAGQQLQVMEGHWATIRSGQSIPQRVQQYRYTPDGTRIEQHIEYQNVESGVEVRPRLSGNRVTLDVRPFRAAPISRPGGAIEKEEIVTTVSGQLGEWIELGGATEQQNSQGQGILYLQNKKEQTHSSVRIKVELANP